MKPKEIKRSRALDEVSTIDEVPEEVDGALEEYKGVGHNKLFEVLPYMKDNQHQGTVILRNFEDPFLHTEFVQDHIIHRFLNWNSRIVL